jgi:hypothetical protein
LILVLVLDSSAFLNQLTHKNNGDNKDHQDDKDQLQRNLHPIHIFHLGLHRQKLPPCTGNRAVTSLCPLFSASA